MSTQKHFILLRGLTRESRHWGDFPTKLKETFPECEMTLLDLPGAGYYFQEKCPLTVREMTQKLRASLSNKNVLEQKNIIFVGVSLGGMVAMDWAQAYPQDLKQVVLINSSAGRLLPFWKRLKPEAAFSLVQSVLSPKKRHEIIFERVCRNKENKEHLTKLWAEIHNKAPVSFENAHRQIIAAARFRLKDKLTVNGVVLSSDSDELVSSDCSKTIAKFLNWPLYMHPWGGHELTDDDPQ